MKQVLIQLMNILELDQETQKEILKGNINK